MIINCVICKTPFEGIRRDQKCCSKECKLKYRTKNRNHHVQIDFACIICGNVFVQKRKDKVTCSAPCTQKLWIKNNPEKDKNRNNGIDAKIRKKKSRTIEILGCSCEFFKLYLESKFESWMSWENYGLWNGESDYGWDIDHIIPISSGNTEDEIIELNHYSNFQPLCSHKNRYIKRNHLNYLEIK